MSLLLGLPDKPLLDFDDPCPNWSAFPDPEPVPEDETPEARSLRGGRRLVGSPSHGRMPSRLYRRKTYDDIAVVSRSRQRREWLTEEFD